MLFDSALKIDDSEDSAPAPLRAGDMQVQDRSLPSWALVLSCLFSATASICLLGIALLAIFFASLVAEQGETLMSPLLAMIGIVPVIAALMLDYAHSRALAGYRQLREAHVRRVEAGVAGAAFLVLSLLHPLLGIGIALAAGLSSLAAWALGRAVNEPFWDFDKGEAIAIFSGRDGAGLRLAASRPQHPPLFRPVLRAIIWLSVLAALAGASGAVATGVLNPAALLSVTLITLWSAEAIARFALELGPAGRWAEGLAERVETLAPQDADEHPGLSVNDLSVQMPGGRSLLAGLAFDLPPGSVTAVVGHSGAGKTLLCQALVAPQDLAGMDVRGSVRMNGRNVWERRASSQTLPMLYLPENPLLLPSSGAENLSCYHDAEALERGKRYLEQLVFSAEDAAQICAASDATRLPSMQRQALGLARAFLLSPALYVMDRPEDKCSDQLVGALCALITREARQGRSFLIITSNRAVLDICDKMIVLQDGRMLDFGDARQIREKMSAGWMRFVSSRTLDSEDHLVQWVRHLFKRPGDEVNRRNISLICAELLAFSCQSADRLNAQRITFEFKHFEGHCLLRMIDADGPVSSGQLELARTQAEQASDIARLTPLAEVMRAADDVNATVELDQRVLCVKVKTYDPRKKKKG